MAKYCYSFWFYYTTDAKTTYFVHGLECPEIENSYIGNYVCIAMFELAFQVINDTRAVVQLVS